MIRIKPTTFQYDISIAGAFGVEKDRRAAHILKPFHIGSHEVTNALWNQCHLEGACSRPAPQRAQETPDSPVVRINWHEAFAFTQWASQKTGDSYRLPTEDEWMLASSLGRTGPSTGVAPNFANKAIQMIAPRLTMPSGSFGANSWGFYDYLGNVWEWTLTCWQASKQGLHLESNPQQLNDPEACSVRIVTGETRAHIQDFIKETYGGGCSSQRPPSNLGFRLVKE